MNEYQDDFYHLMHEMIQACKEVRLYGVPIRSRFAEFPPLKNIEPRDQKISSAHTSPAYKSHTKQYKKPVLTREELEVRGMLARNMRPTDIMKAMFGVESHAPEKMRLQALSKVTKMIRHINAHQKWRKEQEEYMEKEDKE